ncbi:MAG: hypothetical protein ABSE73_26060 [Planctomycetota bacterium]
MPVLYKSKVILVLPSNSRYSPQGFQKLLESYAVVDKTLAELRGKGICAADEEFAVDDNGILKDLQSKLLVAPVGSVVPSILEASVTYPDSNKAAAIAATWAAVFTKEAKEAATENPTKALEKDFLSSKNILVESETRQNRMEAQSGKQEIELQTQSHNQLVGHYRATADALGQYLRETAKLVDAKEADNRVALAALKRDRPSLDWQRVQVDALEKLEIALRQEQAAISQNLQARLMQIDKLALEIAQVPQLLTVRKSASEESTARSQPGGGEKPPAGGFVEQKINPLYDSLSLNLVNLKTEVEPMTMLAKQVAERLKSVHDEAIAMDKTVQADDAALKTLEHTQAQALLLLQAEREVGRRALEQQQALDEAQIKAQTATAVENLRRESKLQLAPLVREIAHQTELHTQISQLINRAEVETTQQSMGEVQVARPAVPALKAQSRYMALRAVLATLIGALLATFFCLMRRPASGAGRRISQAPNGTGK